jgi:hypothetical protein
MPRGGEADPGSPAPALQTREETDMDMVIAIEASGIVMGIVAIVAILTRARRRVT